MTPLAQTRSNEATDKTFIDALLDPSAKHGGLYTFAHLEPFKNLDWLDSLDYRAICKKIFSHLGLLDSDLLESCLASYSSFRHHDITPLVPISEGILCLELHNGPTYAFKDLALQPLCRLLDSLASREANGNGKKYLVLSATSGDTGPATLYGLAGARNLYGVCLYPVGGTSEVQRLQMTTQSARNLKVLGVKGDFDTAQSALKGLLAKRDFKDSLASLGYSLSAANSINIGRIAFQMIYYFVIAKNLKQKPFSIVVPSGNFGNALAGYFALKLGLPISKICIATNQNDVLSDFFNTGMYDLRGRKLKPSISPAMDILRSSNIERLLFDFFGARRTKECMDSLDKENYFCISKGELEKLQAIFESKSFDDDACMQGLATAFKNGIVLDPHSSTAYLFARAREAREVQVILATAHFSKFARTLLMAIDGAASAPNELAVLKILEKRIKAEVDSSFSLGDGITSLFEKEEVHKGAYEVGEIEGAILDFVSDLA